LLTSWAPVCASPEFRDNPEYRFLSSSALGATRTYGIKGISLVAVRAG
jgi:hypothetical protein